VLPVQGMVNFQLAQLLTTSTDRYCSFDCIIIILCRRRCRRRRRPPPPSSSSSSIGTATLVGFGLLNYR